MEKSHTWYRLDNAAKIIPSSAKGADTRVFRISCECTDPVDPDILQDALDEVMGDFPLFRCVLKRGLFWYYLEDQGLEVSVTRDTMPACAPLYFPGRANLLLRVNYYKNRINLEMFHVLADGTGAFLFFRRLVAHYLQLRYHLEVPEGELFEHSSVGEKEGDAFDHFYQKQTGLSQLKSMSRKKAYQLSGEKDENLLPHLIEGTVSAGKMLDLAHEYHTTVGVLVTSIYMQAVMDGMSVRQMRRNPIVVSIPVNLRQFFRSETVRNFFGVIPVSYDPTLYEGTLESILPHVQKAFETQLSEENVRKTMNSYAALEHNVIVKMVPLFIKDFFIGFFNRQVKKGVTTTISNLGQIKMPKAYEPYINKFSAFMAAPSQQICLSSFKDAMVFGEVSPYTTHQVMLNFFRRLTALGVEVEISTNDYDAVTEKWEE